MLRSARPQPVAADAAALTGFAKSLGCPAGYEPSCKINANGVDDRRFLLSFGSDPRIVRATSRFVADMAMPGEAKAAFEADARTAAFIHLGYEEAEGAPRFKLYCERRPVTGRPLYTAWKWRPGESDAASIDDYWIGEDGPASIRDAYGKASAGLSEACVDLYERAAGLGEEPMLLLVRRRGAARRSFDLGLYDAGLPFEAATPLIAEAERAFSQRDVAPRLAELAGEAKLGHVAGGRDDGDAPFVTLYFGARELQ